jgi:hypothetical protein
LLFTCRGLVKKAPRPREKRIVLSSVEMTRRGIEDKDTSTERQARKRVKR